MTDAWLPAPAQSAVFVFLAALAILFPLMPLQLRADAMALPDILFALMAAWLLRRPDTLPMLLLVPLLLLADFILGRPVGLWALLGLIASEFFRGQSVVLRRQHFIVEYLTFISVFSIALVLQWLVLSLALVPQPSGARMFEFFALTVLSYPLIVLFLHYVLYVRAPKPKESFRLGRVG